MHICIYLIICIFNMKIVFQLLSSIQLFVNPWAAKQQATMSYTMPWSLLKLIHWVNGTIQPSHPLSPLLLLPSIFPKIGVFPNESALRIRWPKYWSFSFNISPSNACSLLVSFRSDLFELFSVQWTLNSPAPQFKSISTSVVSILYVQLSIHDDWENHKFHYMDLCHQSGVSAF